VCSTNKVALDNAEVFECAEESYSKATERKIAISGEVY
jgi:hypothetical protein